MTPPLFLVACAAPHSWLDLEAAARELPQAGTTRRTNLTDAPQDDHGHLLTPLPSDVVRSGPVMDICRAMLPSRDIPEICVNRFEDCSQCGPHRDYNNTRDSVIALLGDFSGGALCFEDGQSFSTRYQWLQYPGHRLMHWVAPFEGERITVIPFFRGNTHRAGPLGSCARVGLVALDADLGQRVASALAAEGASCAWSYCCHIDTNTPAFPWSVCYSGRSPLAAHLLETLGQWEDVPLVVICGTLAPGPARRQPWSQIQEVREAALLANRGPCRLLLDSQNLTANVAADAGAELELKPFRVQD